MNNEPNNQKPEESSSGSLLDQIMAAPAVPLTSEEKAVLDAREKEAAEKLKKKPKKPLTVKDFFARLLAGAFAVAVILGTIVGYVIFNPQQAVFINQVFGIAIGDVAKVLKLVLNVTFGTMLVISMGLWLYFLVRSFLKSVKGLKKAVAVFMAVVLGVFFIGIMAGWARVNKELSAFEYFDATLVMYDNDVYLQLPAGQKDQARIENTAELIGPVSIRFNLDGFAKRTMKDKGIRAISRFVIDFDGDGQPDMNGRDVVGNQSFIWKYDRPATGKASQPSGTIYGTDVNNKEVAEPIPFPTISVVASVRLVETKEKAGGVRVAFDAKELKPRGNLEWYVESNPTVVASRSYEFTPSEVFTKTQWVCMNVFQGDTSDGKCKKFFVIRAEGDNLIDGVTALIADPVDYLSYKFRISDLTFKQGVQDTVKWYVDGLLSGDGNVITYKFTGPGTYDVKAVVADTSGNEKEFPERLIIDAPIAIMVKEGYSLKLLDESGQDIIKDTFDKATNSYIVDDVPFPQTVSFDASSVKAASASLRLRGASWDLDGDGVFELSGALSSKLLLTREQVYTVRARYDFVNLSYDEQRLRQFTETVVISTKKSPFDVRLKVIPEQEFAPSTVNLDASSSQAQDGEIVKFIFDYGDGSRNPEENSKGQAIHIYANPGTYTAKVTAFKNDGANQSRSVTFTIRKPQNVATISASVSRGRAGLPVTFDATESRGNPSRVLWDFGDGSMAEGEKADHTFAKAGPYEVKLEIRYSDGTVERDKRSFVVLPNPNAQ